MGIMIIETLTNKKFKPDFPELNWTDMNNASDVSEMFRIFYRNVSLCVLHHVPFKQTTLILHSHQKVKLS